MKNKKVKMISSVVVLAILCGAYVGVKTYVAKQEERDSETEEDETVSVFATSTDDIKSVKFLIDKKEVTFENTEDGWVKSDETEFPVSQDKLDEVAGALNSVNAERVLDDVDDLSQYGLESPQNTITVTTSDGKETKFRIGEENESISQYYIGKDDDEETVYLVAAAVVEPFMDELYDYAQGSDFPDIDSSNVEQIRMEGNDTYTLKNDSGIWSVSDDEIVEKADSAQASSAASTLSSIEYNSFVNYNASDEEMITYGLSDPYANIVIDYQEETAEDTVEADKEEDLEKDADAEKEESAVEALGVDKDKSVESLTEADKDESAEGSTDSSSEDYMEDESVMVSKKLVIHVGNECDDDTRYVSIDDSREVYTISTDTLGVYIDKTLEDFWDKSVCDVYINNLDAIEVDYNGNTDQFNVSRETSTDEDGNETETKTFLMNGNELDEGIKFTTFYNKLTNMAGQKRLTEAYSPEKDPEMKTVITDTDHNKMTIDFYSYDTNYYAAVVDEKVYMVNKMTVKEMFDSYEELLMSGSTTVVSEDVDDIEAVENE